MALPDTGKLVRDKVPQIIKASGRRPQVVPIGEDDFREALERKLSEEIGELFAAPEESRLEELADIYEVVLALASQINTTEQQLDATASAKRNERGGFTRRIWLIDAESR